jgi:hypothetical protein
MTDPESVWVGEMEKARPGPDTAIETRTEYDLIPASVVVRATWRGLTHQCEKTVLPDTASHYAMDRAVWDATVQVRHALVQQQYPGVSAAGARVEVRNDFEAFGAIRSYLAMNPGRYFELIPPLPVAKINDKWFAYFKRRVAGKFNPGDIDIRPPVGVGSTDTIAIENLLRFTEGREPIDG